MVSAVWRYMLNYTVIWSLDIGYCASILIQTIIIIIPICHDTPCWILWCFGKEGGITITVIDIKPPRRLAITLNLWRILSFWTRQTKDSRSCWTHIGQRSTKHMILKLFTHNFWLRFFLLKIGCPQIDHWPFAASLENFIETKIGTGNNNTNWIFSDTSVLHTFQWF